MASERRRSSLSNIISRLHPSNRQERGHTLRPTITSDQDISPAQFRPSKASPSTSDVETPMAIGNGNGQRRLSKIYGSIKSRASSTINIGHRAENTGESAHSNASTVQRPAQSTFGSMKSKASSTANPDHRAEHAVDSAHLQPSQSLGSKVLGSVKSKASSAVNIEHQVEGAVESAHSQASPVQQPAQETQTVFDYKEITVEQQIHNLKTARKHHRRSLRESGDFLGVRGANPRTGRYDVSEGTTSTELSRLSDDYRKRIECERLRQNASKLLSPEAQESLTEVLRKTELEEAEKKQKKKAERSQRIAEREARNQQRAIKWTPDKDTWNKSPLSPIPQSPIRGRSAASSIRGQ